MDIACKPKVAIRAIDIEYCVIQKHHGSREVFLSDLVDNNEMECLDEVVPVCPPGSEHAFDGYLDVFTCEYEYDTTWQARIP